MNDLLFLKTLKKARDLEKSGKRAGVEALWELLDEEIDSRLATGSVVVIARNPVFNPGDPGKAA